MIVKELNITRAKIHLQMHGGLLENRVEQVERLDLASREPRSVGKALCRFDVPPLVDAAEMPRVPAEDGDRKPRASTGRYLAAVIGGDRFEQRGQQIGAPCEDLVVDSDGARQAALAARASRTNAEEADDVGRVGVVTLPLIRLVNPGSGIGGVVTEILTCPKT